MSIRENITAHVVTQINSLAGVKTVTREPKSIDELSPASYPHVLVETANETREHATLGNDGQQVADVDIVLNILVYGSDRDQSRNTVIEAIEEKLALDTSLGGNAFDSFVTDVQVREIAETAPYGQGAIVFRARYYYTRGNA